MKTSLYNNYRKEIRILVSLVILLNVILLSRIFSIQIIQHTKFENILDKETTIIREEEGARGKIYDRYNLELADNITKFNFWVNTAEDFDKQSIASTFSEKFDKDIEHYLNKLNNKNHYIEIEKNVEEIYCRDILDSINDFKGLRFDSSLKRFYPYDNLTSNIVGFFNDQKNNSSGIEKYFNNTLSGQKIDVKHQILDNKKIQYNYVDIPSGKDIVLTLDLDFQSILVNELKKGLENSEAESAHGIIVNPNNGEILAIASIPDFNANKYNEYNIENYKNRAISNSYEPGSTYKIVALTAAIENSKINITDSLNCENGIYKLKNGHILHDHEPHEIISIADVFAFSSNIGMAKISDLLSNQKLYNQSRKFGFGVNTGILLPNEESGILRTIDNWTYQSNKSLAIGQEISCTTLQLAMAYSSIANGGYLLQPSIIKSINNKSIKNSPIVIRTVMKPKTSKIMLSLLERVVTSGSGTNAYLEGYRIGGKTGTAQKFINKAYSESKYISSFASVFPIKNPRYVCVVSIDSPNKSKGKHWGNETAAPIIKEIYKKIINLKNIKPETFIANTDTNSMIYHKDSPISLSIVPDFRGKTLKQAIKVGKYIGIDIKPVGYSGRVVWQSAKAGSKSDDIKICELKVE